MTLTLPLVAIFDQAEGITASPIKWCSAAWAMQCFMTLTLHLVVIFACARGTFSGGMASPKAPRANMMASAWVKD
jgi:hypothetical protein